MAKHLRLLAFWASVSGEEPGGLTNTIEQVWPTVVLRTTLRGPEVDEWRERLADIGAQGFRRYLTEVLPTELKVDSRFAADFAVADESRWNLGFLRWQKRVYAKTHRISVQEILWDGKPVPKWPEVRYVWEEFHTPQISMQIMEQIGRHLVAYKKVSDANIELENRRSLRFIPWVEAYRPGEFQHPHTHTGSPVVGMIALRCGFQKQRIVIEDPRGINPPFGRKWTYDFKEGDVIFFPSWSSHFIDPNRHNDTNVFLSFAIQNPSGVHDFDWEDDGIGALVKTVRKEIRAKKKGKTAKPGGHQAQRQEL